MLVLTRRAGDSVVINDTIKISVVGIQGKKVRLGIVAPKDVSIVRPDAKVQQKKSA